MEVELRVEVEVELRVEVGVALMADRSRIS